MVDPRIMCRKHLLGEHVEHHMFVASINRGLSLTGYLDGNLLEPESLGSRHAALVEEMLARGYAHSSPLPEVRRALPSRRINREAALADLLARCPECRSRWQSGTVVGG